MKRIAHIITAAALAAASPFAHAVVTYSESFTYPFVSWESKWFGQHSNARNFMCYGERNCDERGGNPDGLWLGDPSGGSSTPLSVQFDQFFASKMTAFSIDVAGFLPTELKVWDQHGTVIFSAQVAPTFGAYLDPGVYVHFDVVSGNGIGGFSFSGEAAGNTSVDNLSVTLVPEPGSPALMLAGLAGLASLRRRSSPR